MRERGGWANPRRIRSVSGQPLRQREILEIFQNTFWMTKWRANQWKVIDNISSNLAFSLLIGVIGSIIRILIIVVTIGCRNIVLSIVFRILCII